MKKNTLYHLRVNFQDLWHRSFSNNPANPPSHPSETPHPVNSKYLLRLLEPFKSLILLLKHISIPFQQSTVLKNANLPNIQFEKCCNSLLFLRYFFADVLFLGKGILHWSNYFRISQNWKFQRHIFPKPTCQCWWPMANAMVNSHIEGSQIFATCK